MQGRCAAVLCLLLQLCVVRQVHAALHLRVSKLQGSASSGSDAVFNFVGLTELGVKCSLATSPNEADVKHLDFLCSGEATENLVLGFSAEGTTTDTWEIQQVEYEQGTTWVPAFTSTAEPTPASPLSVGAAGALLFRSAAVWAKQTTPMEVVVPIDDAASTSDVGSGVYLVSVVSGTETCYLGVHSAARGELRVAGMCSFGLGDVVSVVVDVMRYPMTGDTSFKEDAVVVRAGGEECVAVASCAPCVRTPVTYIRALPTAAPPTAVPTLVPPTPVPQTAAPSTLAPPTPVPATNPPSTSTPTAVPTTVPDTPAPPTSAPATPAPETPAPSTPAPPTSAPATPSPPTPAPMTAAPPTSAPATPAPMTAAPSTPAPMTEAPPTSAPPTPAPPTPSPPTLSPPTPAPPTPAPMTEAPSTPAPPTAAPQTPAPLTPSPTSTAPTPTPTPATNPPMTVSPQSTTPRTTSPATFAPGTAPPQTTLPAQSAAPTPSPDTAPHTSASPSVPPETGVPMSSAPLTVVPLSPAKKRLSETDKEKLSTSTKVAGTATVLSGISSGTGPAGAAGAGKLALLRNFGCIVDDIDLEAESNLDFEFHPTQLAWGSSSWRYFYGAVAMNLTILVGVAAMLAILAIVMKTVMRIKLRSAQGLIRSPGFIYIPYLFLLQGTSLVAAKLIFFSGDFASRVLGVAVFVACLLPILFVYVRVFRNLEERSYVVDDPYLYLHGEGEKLVNNKQEREKDYSKFHGVRRNIYQFVFGKQIWVSTNGTHFAEQYGVTYESLRQGKTWYVLLELSVIVLLSLFSAWKPETDVSCNLRNYSITLVLFVFFVLTVVHHPFIAPMDNLIAMILNGLMFLSVTSMSIAISASHPQDSFLYSTAVDLLFAGAVLLTAKCVWDICTYTYDLYIHRRSHARKYTRDQHAQEQMQQSFLGGDVELSHCSDSQSEVLLVQDAHTLSNRSAFEEPPEYLGSPLSDLNSFAQTQSPVTRSPLLPTSHRQRRSSFATPTTTPHLPAATATTPPPRRRRATLVLSPRPEGEADAETEGDVTPNRRRFATSFSSDLFLEGVRSPTLVGGGKEVQSETAFAGFQNPPTRTRNSDTRRSLKKNQYI